MRAGIVMKYCNGATFNGLKVSGGFNVGVDMEDCNEISFNHDTIIDVGVPQVAKGTKKVGRNEVCPCGSNKKYKHCHGK